MRVSSNNSSVQVIFLACFPVRELRNSIAGYFPDSN